MRKRLDFSNTHALKHWLVGAAGIVLTSVSLMESVQKLDISFKKPRLLLAALESPLWAQSDGKYLIEYEESDESESDLIDYSKLVMVTSFEAIRRSDGALIGGLQPLLNALGDFEFSSTIDRSSTACITAGIWVVEPTDPVKLNELKNVLKEYSVMYAFNDSSGFITLNNARMGQGISKIVTPNG